MEQYAGPDVSLTAVSICVRDGGGWGGMLFSSVTREPLKGIVRRAASKSPAI